jgi:hypothetical protein
MDTRFCAIARLLLTTPTRHLGLLEWSAELAAVIVQRRFLGQSNVDHVRKVLVTPRAHLQLGGIRLVFTG